MGCWKRKGQENTLLRLKNSLISKEEMEEKQTNDTNAVTHHLHWMDDTQPVLEQKISNLPKHPSFLFYF